MTETNATRDGTRYAWAVALFPAGVAAMTLSILFGAVFGSPAALWPLGIGLLAVLVAVGLAPVRRDVGAPSGG